MDFDGFFKWEFTSSTKTRGLGGESTRVSDEFSDSTLSFQVIAFVHSLMNTCGTWGKNSSCGCMPRTGNNETERNHMNNNIFVWGEVNGTWCSGQGANGRFFSHDANSTTQRPSKGTCDTGTSSCRCRKPITTLLAIVCIATRSLCDRRCEMPRWSWICWTGLFCEESQWKHWISVRLKLSKLQFVLRNRQISDLICNVAVLRSICQPLIFSKEHSYRSCMKLMDAERVICFCESVRTLTTSMPMCWHLRCSRKFQQRQQENVWPFPEFMQIDASWYLDIRCVPVQDPLTSSFWHSLPRIVWDGQKR